MQTTITCTIQQALQLLLAITDRVDYCKRNMENESMASAKDYWTQEYEKAVSAQQTIKDI